ncbi:ash family protein [Hafnia alvei]|nr:ash family protein [Hafnia alvei]
MTRICKNRLPALMFGRYISHTAAKSAVGISLLKLTYAHNRASGFFMCEALPHLRIMVGRAGASSDAPGTCVPGKANLVRLTTSLISLECGELPKLTHEDANQWLRISSTYRALNTSAQTQISVYTVVTLYLSGYLPNCRSENTANQFHYGYQVCLAISLTTLAESSKSLKTKACCTQRNQNNPFNNLMVSHSAYMRGVLLPARSPEGMWR